jgi:hypothetical protein
MDEDDISDRSDSRNYGLGWGRDDDDVQGQPPHDATWACRLALRPAACIRILWLEVAMGLTHYVATAIIIGWRVAMAATGGVRIVVTSRVEP